MKKHLQPITHFFVTLETNIDVYDVAAHVICMLNKNTLGVKKVRGQSETALQTGATKNFDIG